MSSIIIEARASTILYNFLLSNKHLIGTGKFLIPANVCPIVPVCFLKAEISFDFIDISNRDYCMDKDLLMEYISKEENVRGVMFVRSYGKLIDESHLFKELSQLSEDLFLIDDRCLCIPDIFGENIYPESDLTLFSTGYAKFVELGYGGFAYINEQKKYKQYHVPFSEPAQKMLINQMQDCINGDLKFEYHNSNWLASALTFDPKSYLIEIENRIQNVYMHKSIMNEIYKNNLPQEIQLEKGFDLWRFNIFLPNKNLILKQIFNEGLFASSHFKSVSHIFGTRHSQVADNVHENIINLFNDFRFNIENALKLCDIVKSYMMIR